MRPTEKVKLKDNMFKGKPCRVCGNPIRYKSNETCVACMKKHSQRNYKKPEIQERAREYQKLNNQTRKRKEYMREYMKRYREENKERMDEIQRAYTERNKEEIKKRRKERWDELSEVQQEILKRRARNRQRERRKKLVDK